MDLAAPRPVAVVGGYKVSAGGLPPPDRHLPDLLAVDPPPWHWPHACHRYGHVWEFGSDRCVACTAPWAEFGYEVESMDSEVVTTVEGFGVRFRSVRRGLPPNQRRAKLPDG